MFGKSSVEVDVARALKVILFRLKESKSSPLSDCETLNEIGDAAIQESRCCSVCLSVPYSIDSAFGLSSFLWLETRSRSDPIKSIPTTPSSTENIHMVT